MEYEACGYWRPWKNVGETFEEVLVSEFPQLAKNTNHRFRSVVHHKEDK